VSKNAKLADMLHVKPSALPKRFIGSSPTVFHGGLIQIRSGRPDIVYTIIALGELTSSNGLPTLGEKEKDFYLKSGEALHFGGDVMRTYAGKGGVLLLMQWNNRRA